LSKFVSFINRPNKKQAKANSERNKKDIQRAEELVQKYRSKYADVDLNVLRNLTELKDTTKQPKSDKPDASYKTIKKNLGKDEISETIRQERWASKIKCPFCKSTKTRKLAEEKKINKKVFKYKCETCKEFFNPETNTDLEDTTPPISDWMLCWYLYGCTNSLEYIASKLGVDIDVIEQMIGQMKDLFGADKPLSKFTTFDEWAAKQGRKHKSILAEAKTKLEVLFQGDTAKVPHDTAELRRQRKRGIKPRF